MIIADEISKRINEIDQELQDELESQFFAPDNKPTTYNGRLVFKKTYRVKRAVLNVLWRLRETWQVLLHGIPEVDYDDYF